MISPSMMLSNGIMPPMGVRLSCMVLTAPQEASVVTVVKSAELAMPKRISLPSILPPGWSALGVMSMPSFAKAGFPAPSAE